MTIQAVSGEIKAKPLNENFSYLDSEVDARINKEGIGEVSWKNMSQEAKENIAGNKTAVVGVDSVNGKINIIDDTVPLANFTPEVRNNIADYVEQNLDYIPGWFSYATTGLDKWTPNSAYTSIIADCEGGELWSCDCTISGVGMSIVIFWKDGKRYSDLGRDQIGNHTNYKFKIPEGVSKVTVTSHTINNGLVPILRKFVPINTPKIQENVTNIKQDMLIYTPKDLEVKTGFLTYASTDVTKITPNETYRTIVSPCNGNEKWSVDVAVNDSSTSAVIFWDNNGKFINDLERGVGEVLRDYKFITPANAKFVSSTSLTDGLVPILRQAEYGNLSQLSERIAHLETKSNRKTRIIVNFGDSIIGNARPPKDISTVIQNYLGDMVINLGFGGCMMSKRFPRTDNAEKQWDAWSMQALSRAIATKDFTQQRLALEPGNTLPGYFRTAYNILIGIDWDKVDIVTIEYGTNDYTYSDGGRYLKLDNEIDPYDLHSYGGSLRYSIENLYSVNNRIQILLTSPNYRFWLNDDLSFLEDSDEKLIDGKKLYDFCETMEKVAKEYKIPYLDMYKTGGINKHNRKAFYEGKDGTHPVYSGNVVIGMRYAKFIESNTW